MPKKYLENNSMYLPQPLLVERQSNRGYLGPIYSKHSYTLEPLDTPLYSSQTIDLSQLNQSLHLIQENTSNNKEFEQLNLTKASQRLQNKVATQRKQLKQMFDYDLDRNTLLKRRAELFSPNRFRKLQQNQQ
ncbi:Hypothetical_protein [Hexamita inflata]|uniref:Hypothetical_protein n=1 Tax=Hexamita inflata TaxID=28002 RepID=A0AA86PIL9_9EUKA|nr:Hypothetical protein HINF_LOCUS23977 [Hexamita inflata]